MLTLKELEERRGYIGASEAAAVLGLSRWKTPVEVWAEKTGAVPIEQTDSIAAEVGTELEDYIARRFTRETGKKVHRVNEAFELARVPFIRAHIDRKIEGERSILQCKTCSAYKWRDWDGEEIPLDYIIQEYVELACSGYEKAYIAVLIGNHDFKIKELVRDDKAIGEVTTKLRYFWETYVLTKVMPTTISKNDDQILNKLFPVAEQTEVALPDKANAIIESIESLNQDKTSVEGQIKKLKNELKAMVKENEVGMTGIYRVRWANIHKDSYTMPEQNYRLLTYTPIRKEA